MPRRSVKGCKFAAVVDSLIWDHECWEHDLECGEGG